MKKKKASDKQSVGHYVRLTPSEGRKLETFVKGNKISFSEAIRRALRNYGII